jgi:hypothetical protein
MRKTAMALMAASMITLPFSTAYAGEQEEAALRSQLSRLSTELDTMKAKIAELERMTNALADQQEATTKIIPVPSKKAVASIPTASETIVANEARQVSLFGYGEINYNNYDHDPSRNQVDLRRAVLGVGYRFNDDTRLVSEFEFEHAVTSASDPGEVEVEQFYIDHRLTQSVNLKAGLILIPTGLLNTSHEPPRYFGVERNFVETQIIPSTLREGGLALYGTTGFGLSWDVGITTAPDLNKWDSTSTEGQESPLGSIHQELANAKAGTGSGYLSLNYVGMPGLNLGGSLITSGVGQRQAGSLVADSRATLWEAHTRWTPGRFDLSALYARGTLSNTQAYNLANVGNPTPIPEAFFGWYLQSAYRVWEHGTYSLMPFVRYERVNTASSYADQPAGLGTPAADTETILTSGFNFYLNPNVVFKGDYQAFTLRQDDRFNLGMGLMF